MSGTASKQLTGLTTVKTYEIAVFAQNDIGNGPTTASANYLSVTTYGVSAAPAQPTLV